jgi:HrpA-like RNA helicase
MERSAPRSRGRGENRGNYNKRGGRGQRGRGGRYIQKKRVNERIQTTRIIDRTELPIYQHKDSILKHIEKYSMGIVEAATGSGKSTQIPQFILEKYPDCKIIVAQTNKLGANEVANRVAEELNTQIGDKVGTLFKGDIKVSENTKIFFTTTDILLEHSLNENFQWDFVIIDEVHERSLETDLLLAVIKLRLNEDKGFKLLIMSATIQNILPSYFSSSDFRRPEQKFLKKDDSNDVVNWDEDFEEKDELSEFRNKRNNGMSRSAPVDVFHNEDRIFEIEEIYLEKIIEIVNTLNTEILHQPELSLIDYDSIYEKDADTNPSELSLIAYRTGCKIILTQHLKLFRDEDKPYTFLVFLPGLVEINIMFEELMHTFKDNANELEVILLHTSVPESEYEKIFVPPEEGKRRVILSGSIAESSITLPDVRFIIDFGMNRETAYNTQKNSDSFDLVWAAKSVMKQRAGRAGRVANGIVFRLMPRQFFQSMLYEYARPEIQRSSLDKIILKLKLKHIENLRDLLGNILEAPDDIEIHKTEKHLIEMGALNQAKKITKLGEIYSEFPFEIRVTRICMFGILFQCVKPAMKIGAIISLEKGPIKSFSGLPGNNSKNHPQTYKSRLVFDFGMNSDLIMMMNAYDKWYENHGKQIKSQVFNNGQRISLKHRIQEDESKFCGYHNIDPFVLREILCLYCEIKQKFISIGLDKRYFKIIPRDKGLTLKFCITAAFPGKYLISNYELIDEVSRDRLSGKMGENPKTTLLIPDIPPSILPSDIDLLIGINVDKPKKTSIVYSNGLIQYHNNVNSNTIKFVLWLGRYSRRYYNLAWVLMKRVTRDHNNRIIMRSLVNISINELNKVPIGMRREGMIVDVNSENTANGVIVDEIVFLCKPEYPYRLAFKDIASRSDIIVEDDSVNSQAFTTNPEISQKLLLVCSDYIQRKNLTIGKYSTLMPFIPLLPQIFCLIFCDRLEYIPNLTRQRYLGFKFLSHETIFLFDYHFTSEDAKIINKIRYDITQCLGHKDFLENKDNKCPIKDDIIHLLRKKRIPIRSDIIDWKNIIKWKTESIRSEPQLEVPGCLRLLDINEDSSMFYDDDQMEQVKISKKQFVDKLVFNASKVGCSKIELVCKECGEVICDINGITKLEEDPPIFSIVPYYGVLKTVDQLPYNSDYANYVSNNYRVSSWEICNNNHIVAWNEDQYTFVCEESPVWFRLPMMHFYPLTKEFWNSDFFELKKLSAAYKKEYDNIKFELNCLLCETDFKNSHDFCLHISSQAHKSKVEIFLEPYISDY